MSSRYIILLALAFLLLGCSARPSPKDVLLRSLEKSEKLSSLSTELEMNLTSVSSGVPTSASALVTQYLSKNRMRADMNISGVPGFEGIELRAYTLENGSYICGKTAQWDCIPMNSTSQLGEAEAASGPMAFSQRSRKLLNADALEFLSGVESREAIGRKCSFVSARINYTKAREAEPGLFPEGVKNAQMSQCLDEETGIALTGNLVVEENTDNEGIVVSQLEFAVIRFEPNQPIPEETYSLPK